jgi:hypothetical protein
MPLYGPEPIVDAVVERLKDALPAALVSLAGEFTDSFDLTPPYDGGTGDDYDRQTDAYWPWLMDPRLLPSYPAVIIRLKQQSDAPELGSSYEIGHQVVVDLVITDSDVASCTRRMWRYVRAVRETLAAPGVTPDVGQFFCAGVGWGEPELVDETTGEYLQDIPVTFTIQTSETSTPAT